MNLKERMFAGEKVCGTMLRISNSPAVPILARNAGLDFLMYDCEHGKYSLETLHDLFVASNLAGLPSMVRVPDFEKSYISRALDVGAKGVMVPMTETEEQARILAKYSKYSPIGERGFNATSAHNDYVIGAKFQDTMEKANNEVLAIAMIETPKGVENVDAIAAVEGIDVLLIGPNDLNISMDLGGDTSHPKQVEAMIRVAEACKKHGKIFGIHGPAAIHERFAQYTGFMMETADMNLLANGFKGIKAHCDQLSR